MLSSNPWKPKCWVYIHLDFLYPKGLALSLTKEIFSFHVKCTLFDLNQTDM